MSTLYQKRWDIFLTKHDINIFISDTQLRSLVTVTVTNATAPTNVSLPCARPPENCRQDFIYDYVNGEWCPVACRLVCDCPTPTPESLEFCKNTDPLCFATKDLITLEDGKRCFNGCLLACQSPAAWRKKFISQQ